jgi:hypothetical protein
VTLDALRGLDAARTPSPWNVILDENEGDTEIWRGPSLGAQTERVAGAMLREDAAFIAACSTAVPLLIRCCGELERLVRMLEDDGCLEAPEDLDDARAALAVLNNLQQGGQPNAEG